jgi:hypothetical protein
VASTASAQKRQAKTLVNTFPFNQPGSRGQVRAANDAAAAQAHEQADSPRASRQGAAPAPAAAKGAADDGAALDIGSVAAAGERCIDKVVMVEETEYDEHIECHHSYSERCHTTYTTDFEPQQEEECEENFKKSCFIEYKKVAQEEPIRFCHTPLICEGEGPEECKTVYESQCETRYHEHEVEDDVVDCKTEQEEKCEDVTQGYTTEQKCTKWPKQVCDSKKANVKKYSPETECKKVPRELCGPSGCELKPGPEECFDKKDTVVQEVREHKPPLLTVYILIVNFPPLLGSRGDLQPGAAARLQARDQAGAPAEAGRGVRRHPEGGVLQVEEEPAQGAEARRQEVVLPAHQGVRPRRLSRSHTIHGRMRAAASALSPSLLPILVSASASRRQLTAIQPPGGAVKAYKSCQSPT